MAAHVKGLERLAQICQPSDTAAASTFESAFAVDGS